MPPITGRKSNFLSVSISKVIQVRHLKTEKQILQSLPVPAAAAAAAAAVMLLRHLFLQLQPVGVTLPLSTN
jgi:hypothetical protein